MINNDPSQTSHVRRIQKLFNQQQENVKQPTAQAKSEGSQPFKIPKTFENTETNERQPNAAKWERIVSPDESKRREHTTLPIHQENFPKIKTNNKYGIKSEVDSTIGINSNKYENDVKLANNEACELIYENVDTLVDEKEKVNRTLSPDSDSNGISEETFQNYCNDKPVGTIEGTIKNVQETKHGVYRR